MPKKSSTYETAVVLSDSHHPFHDQRAIDSSLTITKDIRPKIIFLDGDIADCYQISDFNKDPLVGLSLQTEIDSVYKFLLQVRNVCPDSKIIYIDGNHEFRLKRYLIKNAKELVGLTRACSGEESPALSWPNLLRFKELGIQHVSSGRRESQYRYGKQLMIGHWDRVNKHSGYTAKNLIEDKHISLIQGHTHRLGSSYRTVRDHRGLPITIAGFENGCLCDLSPEYVTDPNWQHGFSVVHKKIGGDRFNIQQIPIIDYVAFYGEKEYRAN